MLPYLDKLAEKLGTTSDHVWQILMNQVAVETKLCTIWTNIALYGFGGSALLMLGLIIYAIVTDCNESWPGACLFLFLISFIIGLIIFACNYSILLTLQNNPEFWALQQILGVVK
jgi:hypothetical protein